jgi:hypothetical protein
MNVNKYNNTLSLKKGIYIQDNNDGYWHASRDQATAYNNFPIYKYTGMGSSYWYANSKAIEKVKGIVNIYNMIFDGTNLWLKTSDGVTRHMIKISDAPKPPY